MLASNDQAWSGDITLKIAWWLTVTACLLAVCIVLQSMFLVGVAYNPLPIMDYWEVVLEDGSWGTLFRQHNEHFLTFPKLVYGLDTHFAAATGILDLIVIWALEAATCAILAWLGISLGLPAAASIALSVALFFWARHAENLVSPFQVAIIGLCTVVAATFALAALAAENGRRSFWVASIALAATAPFWSLNGLLVPLAGVWFCVTTRQRRVLGFAFLGVFVASVVIYACAERAGTSSEHALDALHHPWLMVTIFFDVLADPVLDLVNPDSHADWRSWVVGGALTAWVGAEAVRACLRGTDPMRAALIAIALFGVGSAGLIALGRLDLGYVGPAYRYAVFAVLVWLPMVMLALFRVSEPRRPIVVAAVSLVVVGLVLFNYQDGFWVARWLRDRKAEATAKILANPDDPKAAASTYPAPQALLPVIAEMRRRQLSIFSPWK